MFESQNDYLKRLEEDFQRIKKNFAAVNWQEQGREQVQEQEQIREIPQRNAEIESYKKRFSALRKCANRTSSARYLKGAQSEVLLANLITQVLAVTDDSRDVEFSEANNHDPDFFEVLASTKELKLDKALEGFEFFDNNPFKTKAERKLAKIQAKKEKRMRK